MYPHERLLNAGIAISTEAVIAPRSADSPVCFVNLRNRAHDVIPSIATNQLIDSIIPNAAATPTPPLNFHHTGQLLPIIAPTKKNIGNAVPN